MATLKDLMDHQWGKPPEMDTAPIKSILGDSMPEIEPTPVGRLRLLHALRGKFGANYKNAPGVSKAMDHFESEYNYFRAYRKIKAGRAP